MSTMGTVQNGLNFLLALKHNSLDLLLPQHSQIHCAYGPMCNHGAHPLVPSSACQATPTVEKSFRGDLEEASFLITGKLEDIGKIILSPASTQHIAGSPLMYAEIIRCIEGEMFLKRVRFPVQFQVS